MTPIKMRLKKTLQLVDVYHIENGFATLWMRDTNGEHWATFKLKNLAPITYNPNNLSNTTVSNYMHKATLVDATWKTSDGRIVYAHDFESIDAAKQYIASYEKELEKNSKID